MPQKHSDWKAQQPQRRTYFGEQGLIILFNHASDLILHDFESLMMIRLQRLSTGLMDGLDSNPSVVSLS